MNRAHHKSPFLQSLTLKRIQQFFFKTALALAALVPIVFIHKRFGFKPGRYSI